MEPRSVPASELHRRFAEHIDAVLRGDEFVVTRNGRPSARLTPVPEEHISDQDDD